MSLTPVYKRQQLKEEFHPYIVMSCIFLTYMERQLEMTPEEDLTDLALYLLTSESVLFVCFLMSLNLSVLICSILYVLKFI